MTAGAFAPFTGVAVVTGANSGLGFETARKIATMSPRTTVVLGCRDPEKGLVAQDAIRESTGNARVRAARLDLSSLDSVRGFARECLDGVDGSIDVLVCNAGIAGGNRPTVDGLDPVFETNHLGHFLLARLLLPHFSLTGRVISVSSDMHAPPGPRLRWPGAETLAEAAQNLARRRRRYSYSKLCNLYFTYELSRRLRADGTAVSASAFNPGLMTDTGFATMPAPVAAVMKRVFASRVGSLDSSSTALANLAAGETHTDLDGRYFDRTADAWTRSSALSYDVDNARELWRVSSRLIDERIGQS